IAVNLDDLDLVQSAGEVMEKLVVKELEAGAGDGRSYMVHITPYKTLDNYIDGVVLTFIDITDIVSLRRHKEILHEAREYAEAIVATVREPLLILDADMKVVSANRAFYHAFRVSPEETQGRLIYDVGNHQWDIPRLKELLEGILPGKRVFEDFLVEHDFPKIGKRRMLLNARQIYREGQDVQLILLAVEDITERKASSRDLQEGDS
ncbi:MAG: PAS domain-containing protein, partial [bacterium]|nr:PAS domain-containing protein [bacterium]